MSGRIVILGDVVSSGSWTASAGTAQTIDTITGVANNAIKTAEYTIHIENGSNMQAQKSSCDARWNYSILLKSMQLCIRVDCLFQ